MADEGWNPWMRTAAALLELEAGDSALVQLDPG